MKTCLKTMLVCMLLMLLAIIPAGAEQMKGGTALENATPIAIYGDYLVTMNEQEAEWLVFQADQDPAYYWANLTNHDLNTTLYMTLYDKNGLKIEEVDATKGQYDYISWKAAPGETYYLRFVRYRGSENGRFTLFLDKAADIYGNDMQSAQEVQLDEKILSSFDGTNDVDFFTFKAVEGRAYYRVDFKNENIGTTVYMALLDKNGLTLAEADATNGQSDYLSWEVTPGETYYLRFRRYDGYRGGQYTFNMFRTPDKESNSMEMAEALEVNTTVIASFDGTYDVDFMQITAEEGSAYYRADFKNENIGTTMYMKLLDKNGLTLAEADASHGQSDYLSWKVTPGETYFLQFTRYDGYRNGTYIVTMQRYADAEPNEMICTEDIPFDQTVKASFDGSHDVDFFRFTAKEASINYLVDFKNENIGTTMYVELLDENGLSLLRAEAGNGRTGWLNWYTTENKVYYLKCYRYDAFRGGEYTLKLTPYEDIESSKMTTGPVLDANQKKTFSLGAKEDVDWFSIPAAEASVFTYLTLGNFDTCGRMYAAIYNSANQELASWRIDNQKENVTRLPQSNETLYLKVTGDHAGYYTLLRQDTADEGGNSQESALKAAGAQDGILYFEIKDDEDYLAFPSAGSALLLTCDAKTTVYVTMVDQNGQALGKENRIYGNASALFLADRNQVYLKIRGSEGSLRFACCTPDTHVLTGSWQEAVSASCTRQGLRQMLCAVCGQVAQEEALAVLSHQAGQWQRVRAAGCDDAGQEARYCLNCAEMLEEKEVPATGHLQTSWKTVITASCEGEGLQYQVCNDCGKQLNQEIIPATGHVAGEWKISQRADCDTDGLQVRQCRVCRITLEENITPASGHTPGEWYVYREPTCETEGLQLKGCTICRGTMEEKVLSALGHAYSDWVEVTAPTRNEEGVQEQTCSRCGNVQHQSVPKLTLVESLFGR